MASLVLDSGGKPAPQYKRDDGTAYEELKGSSGAMNVNVKELPTLVIPELPVGANLIGKVKLVDSAGLTHEVSNIFKYVAACEVAANTNIWTPASGKSIVLKGIRLQNLTNAEASVATGLGTPDAVVSIKSNTSVIGQVKLQGHHTLSDLTDKIYLVAGNFEAQTLDFGSGLVLPVDAVLYVLSDIANVTVSAWGYEV